MPSHLDVGSTRRDAQRIHLNAISMTAIAAGNGNAFDSISQACFLIKPRQTESPASTPLRKGKGKGKRKIAPAENAAQPPSKKSMLDLFQRLEEGQEKVEAVEMRMKLYQETWQRMRHRIDNVLRDINLQTLLEIDRFVQDVPDIEAEAKSEIPTGLVFAGINVADHASLFNQMTTMIQDNDPNLYFANLQSKDCANLKAIVKNTIEAFIFAEDKQHEDQEDEMEETAFIVPKGHTRLAPDDMHLLLGWYRHIRKDRNARPKLVIVLQDFERIEPLVIQDFINILSEYSDRIPFILLIGIATSFEAIHQALPTSVISLLAIEKFYVQPPTSSFNAIIKELFLNSPDLLHYGPKAFKIFNDNFFLHNFSIETLASALKYTCMHHFYGNALSIFNVGDPNEMYTIRDTLSPFHYTALRMLPSFKELCESASEQDPLRVKKLLTSDVHLYEELEGALHDMQQYQQDFAIGFEVLLLVIDRMPTRPSMPRKTPRQLHFMALEEDLHATSYLQDVCFACRNLQYSVFESTLNDIAAYLQSILSENELLRVVQDFQEQLGKIDGEAADAVANKNTDTQRLFGRSNLPSKAAKVDTTAADALTSLAESFSQWLAQLFE